MFKVSTLQNCSPSGCASTISGKGCPSLPILQFLDALASLGSMLQSQWVSNVFEILSNLGHIFMFQGVFILCSECVLSVFRVCSDCVQSVFSVCSECVQSVFRVS